ncbi:hypothetical protein PsorP6_019301 [Peronosclerospora sorghi]|nr:hypothetical protein PsorP6_019301 [Peronosclerospora sorghi]
MTISSNSPQCFCANGDSKGYGRVQCHKLSTSCHARLAARNGVHLPVHVWSTGLDGTCHLSSHLLYWLVPLSLAAGIPASWFSATLIKVGIKIWELICSLTLILSEFNRRSE